MGRIASFETLSELAMSSCRALSDVTVTSQQVLLPGGVWIVNRYVLPSCV